MLCILKTYVNANLTVADRPHKIDRLRSNRDIDVKIATLENQIGQHHTSEEYRNLDRQIARQPRSTLDSGYLKTITGAELRQELDPRD